MVHDSYYLIRPSAALTSRIEEFDEPSPLLADLTHDFFWSKREPDRSGARAEDHLAQVKLLFIAYLIEDHLGDPMVDELFGELAPSISNFDKWWTVCKFEVDVIFEWYARNVSPEIAYQIEKTDLPLVDNWIRKLQAGDFQNKKTD